MRIISKFHDYYDIGLQYGIDPKLVYARETSSITIPDGLFPRSWNIQEWESIHGHAPRAWSFTFKDKRGLEYHFDKHVVLFCGKLYPFLDSGRCSKEQLRFYTIEAFQKFVEEKQIVLKEKHFRDRWYVSYSLKGVELFLKLDYKEDGGHYGLMYGKLPTEQELIDFHRSVGSPIIDITMKEKDPCLKDLEFAKAVDPYTAFNELSMFMGNVIGIGDPETIEIDDKYKIAERGFNEQSFRHPFK